MSFNTLRSQPLGFKDIATEDFDSTQPENNRDKPIYQERQRNKTYDREYHRPDFRWRREPSVNMKPQQTYSGRSHGDVRAGAGAVIDDSETADHVDMIIEAQPPVNYYNVLGISKNSAIEYSAITVEVIQNAAKKQRIATHPDRLIKPGTPATEAMRIKRRAADVGEAAVILLNTNSRSEHDKDLQQRG
ncbi:hypothetical protein MMC13_005945 [Lambiella insularis]|nr:hypothetical protein [Lambiella insularis]